MSATDPFHADLREFVNNQASRVEAARILGIKRQDLYRYLNGASAPREKRKQQIIKLIGAPTSQLETRTISQEFSGLDTQSVTRLRDMMLHLVSLIDLDLAGRTVNERKSADSETGRPAR
ncbi:MAG: hypothetical protein DI606_16665 [Sphingobium sp.]|nr:MAG: hypothetical protein DI606_16665 [Sphingobium sp.]